MKEFKLETPKSKKRCVFVSQYISTKLVTEQNAYSDKTLGSEIKNSNILIKMLPVIVLIDCWLFNVQRQIFRASLGQEYVQQYIIKRKKDSQEKRK